MARLASILSQALIDKAAPDELTVLISLTGSAQFEDVNPDRNQNLEITNATRHKTPAKTVGIKTVSSMGKMSYLSFSKKNDGTDLNEKYRSVVERGLNIRCCSD